MSNSSIPIATKWLLDAVGEPGRSAIKSVCMLVSPRTQEKGTAFLLKTGLIISNWHVVQGSPVEELIGRLSDGNQIRFTSSVVDQNRDLAALTPAHPLEGGLVVRKDGNIYVGVQVTTWGYPLGYNGPTPLLSVGFLSGFNDSPPYEDTTTPVKHLVVNGAFNPGNSGGPLFLADSDEVIGVVVSKHAPIPEFVNAAMQALARQRSGFVFTSRDEHGNTRRFTEAQLISEVLTYFRQMTQVMIGEAIASSELISFLEENDLS